MVDGAGAEQHSTERRRVWTWLNPENRARSDFSLACAGILRECLERLPSQPAEFDCTGVVPGHVGAATGNDRDQRWLFEYLPEQNVGQHVAYCPVAAGDDQQRDAGRRKVSERGADFIKGLRIFDWYTIRRWITPEYLRMTPTGRVGQHADSVGSVPVRIVRCHWAHNLRTGLEEAYDDGITGLYKTGGIG